MEYDLVMTSMQYASQQNRKKKDVVTLTLTLQVKDY